MSGERRTAIASANAELESVFASSGRGPAPAAATMFAQKGWLKDCFSVFFSGTDQIGTYSPKNGTTAVERPYKRPHAVVPAPP